MWSGLMLDIYAGIEIAVTWGAAHNAPFRDRRNANPPSPHDGSRGLEEDTAGAVWKCIPIVEPPTASRVPRG